VHRRGNQFLPGSRFPAHQDIHIIVSCLQNFTTQALQVVTTAAQAQIVIDHRQCVIADQAQQQHH